MNKQEIYDFLKNKGIPHEITEHSAVFTMDELSEIKLPYPDSDAKNLFVRDDKKENFFLITVKGNKKVNLKEFRKENGLRNLSFASENELFEIMHLTPGSVTPLGILNDDDRRVKVFIDSDFFEYPEIIGVHPNDNTATVWLNVNDLADIIKKHGNQFNQVKIPE